MVKTVLAFSDVHIPYGNPTAVEVFKKTLACFQPDICISLGDLLDCGQFSAHPPTLGVPQSDYESDLAEANGLIDFVQRNTKQRTILIEGNHGFRVDRWAAKTSEGRGAYTLLAPRLRLMAGRSKCTYIPYGSINGKYPHYKLNSRIVAVHGWSYAQHATKEHLRKSQGKSVIHGHCHRADACIFPNIWGAGTVQARSAGCLCKPIPLYGTGNPVEWINAFIIGYLGSHSDTLYTIPIMGNSAVLPDGKEVRV